MCNGNGDPVGIIGISVDITDRKKAAEMKAKKEAAEKVARFASAVAGTIAHELRNPLSAIMISTEIIMDQVLPDIKTKSKNEKYRLHFNKIIKLIKSTSYVVEDMLAKIKAFSTGKTPKLNAKENFISTDIKECLEDYPFKEDEKELIELNKIKQNDFKYMGDAILTRGVLSNLIKNSLAAVKESSKKEKLVISIELRTDVDNKYNYLIFKDNAIGMPKEYKGEIFNCFETKRLSGNGTGLGLYYCKMIMQSYKGDIVCDSVEGKYTEFTLKFLKIE
jgi:two-component system CAI-1 autoinducer sensor kinase/phosphatase CqsS